MQHTPSRHDCLFSFGEGGGFCLGSKCNYAFSLETSLAISFSLLIFCHFFFPPVLFLIFFVYTRCFLFSGQILLPLAFCYILLSLALPSPSSFLPYPVCVYKICPSMKTTARQKGKDSSSLTIPVMLAR